MKCDQCGKKHMNEINFCTNCGRVFTYPEILDEEYYDEYKKRIKAFCQGLQASNNLPNNEMWDSSVTRYMLSVQKVKQAAENKMLKRYSSDNNLYSGLDNFMARCKKNEFHIALVGVINAGKSTLLNALFNRELASTSVTPETASLTKFKASTGSDYLKISFYSVNEWDELWKSVEDANAEIFKEEYNELNAGKEKEKWVGQVEIYEEYKNEEILRENIRKWTSSKSATHYFVKEVEVGLKKLDIPRQIVYVDTPGLDDPVDYRSNITRNYIERANVVLVCVRAAGLTGQELETINKVFINADDNPNKVCIMGTQIDALTDIEDDWTLQKKVWLKHLSKETCFKDKELADNNVIGTAAYVYTLLKKFKNNDLTNKEKNLLFSVALKLDLDVNNPNDYKHMINFSNIPSLRNKIEKEFLVNSNRLMLRDIKQKYIHCKRKIYEAFDDIKKRQTELIFTANSTIEEIRKKIMESQEAIHKQQFEKREFDNLIDNFKIQATERANGLFSTIKSFYKID